MTATPVFPSAWPAAVSLRLVCRAPGCTNEVIFGRMPWAEGEGWVYVGLCPQHANDRGVCLR